MKLGKRMSTGGGCELALHMWLAAGLTGLCIACPQAAHATVTAASTGWNSAHDLSSWDDSTAWHTDQDYVIPKGKTLISGKKDVNDITFPGGPLTVGDSSGSATFIFYRSSVVRYPRGITIVNGSGCNANFGVSGSQEKPDYNTYTYHLHGDISVVSTHKTAPQFTSVFRSNGQYLYFMGALSGDAYTGMKFSADEWSNVNTNNFAFFMGDLTGYHGYLEVANNGKAQGLALGPSPCPGKVKLSGGANAFLRTATPTNDATIAKLEMSANSSLYPVIDMVKLTNGTVRVTSQLSLTAPVHVCARFTGFVKNVAAPETWFPILSCPAAAGALNIDDFDLVPMDAGDGAEELLSLSVRDDSNGVPTLWLVKQAYAPDDSTVPVLSVSDGSGESAFLEGWASHWSPAGVPAAGRDYIVKDGKILRTPYFQPAVTTSAGVPGEDQTFGGDSITLGDAASTGEIQHWGYNKVVIPRLVVSNGCYTCSGNWTGNRHAWLDAPIEIAAADPSKAVFKTGATWQHLYLLGKVTGGESSACRMYFTNSNSEMLPQGDWSEYYGLLELACSSSAMVGDVKFGGSATAMPGKLRIGSTTAEAGGSFRMTFSGGLAVSALEVNRPVTLHVGLDASALAGAPLVVTNSLTLNAKVSLSLDATGDIISRTDNADAAFIPVLKVATKVAGSLDETMFEIGGVTGASLTPASLFALEKREEAGFTVLGLAKRRVIHMLSADDATTNSTTGAKTARTSFDREWEAADGDNTGRAAGWNWSVNARPQPDCDYYVDNGKTLRTHSSDAEAFFRGHALYLRGPLLMQSDDVTVTNCHLIGGLLQAVHHGGRGGMYSFLPESSLTRTFYGDVAVHANSSVASPATAQFDGLRLACGFSGSAMLTVAKNSNSLYAGFVDMAGDNTSFSGIMKFSDNYASASPGTRMTVIFSGADNLGGEMAAFAYNGVWLTRHATLRPSCTASYSRENRGIYVETAGGIDVAEGEAFTVDAQVTWHGQLVKYGAGVLRFGKAPKFMGADGKTIQDAPIANAPSNLVRVTAGSIGVTMPTACDGLTLVMEDGASLQVDVDSASGALATQGLVNTKSPSPFVLDGTDGKLHVSFDMSGATGGARYTVAVCTLPAAEAAALRQNIVLEKPPLANYKAELLPAESSGAATETIFVEVAPGGFSLIFR